jgi:hypothetical protein
LSRPHGGDKPRRSYHYIHLLALALVAFATALRVVYLVHFCPCDLAPDEAHYWDWSRHLDYAYYSKGPLVAWLIRASCRLFGDTMPAVRLPAVLCGGLTLLGLYVLTLQVYRNARLGLLVVAGGLIFPVLAAGSLLMTIDAPLVSCWTWALVCGHRAIFGSSVRAWCLAGVCVALGVLAKPTMVLLPLCVLLLLAFTPALRALLRQRGFWLMCGLGALGGLPILLWNVQHDWVTFRHTLGHAGLQQGRGLHWEGPAVYLGTQFALLLGFWFVAWLRAMWTHRPTCEPRLELRYLWWMSLPVLVFFGLFSLKNGGGEANWPMPAYLSGMVLVAGWLLDELRHPLPWLRRLTAISTAAFTLLGLLLTILMHSMLWVQPLLHEVGHALGMRSSPIRRLDPTCRLRGWQHLAKEVDRIRSELRDAGEEPVLAAGIWNLPGELGFYCDCRPTVYCLGAAFGDRHSQYDFQHPGPVADANVFLGSTFIVVSGNADVLRVAFDEVQPARLIRYCENGQEVNRWCVHVCRGFRGFVAFSSARRY